MGVAWGNLQAAHHNDSHGLASPPRGAAHFNFLKHQLQAAASICGRGRRRGRPRAAAMCMHAYAYARALASSCRALPQVGSHNFLGKFNFLGSQEVVFFRMRHFQECGTTFTQKSTQKI